MYIRYSHALCYVALSYIRYSHALCYVALSLLSCTMALSYALLSASTRLLSAELLSAATPYCSLLSTAMHIHASVNCQVLHHALSGHWTHLSVDYGAYILTVYTIDVDTTARCFHHIARLCLSIIITFYMTHYTQFNYETIWSKTAKGSVSPQTFRQKFAMNGYDFDTKRRDIVAYTMDPCIFTQTSFSTSEQCKVSVCSR
jgi:hypothetical protein